MLLVNRDENIKKCKDYTRYLLSKVCEHPYTVLIHKINIITYTKLLSKSNFDFIQTI